MKHKKIEKFILNIFRVLPLLCLLLFMLYVCLTGFTKVKTNTYDTTNVEQITEEDTTYNYQLNTIYYEDFGSFNSDYNYLKTNYIYLVNADIEDYSMNADWMYFYQDSQRYYLDYDYITLLNNIPSTSYSFSYDNVYICFAKNSTYIQIGFYHYSDNVYYFTPLLVANKAYTYITIDNITYIRFGYGLLYDTNQSNDLNNYITDFTYYHYFTNSYLDDFTIVNKLKYYMNEYVFQYTDTLFNSSINAPLNAFTNAINLNNNSIYYSYIKFSYLYLIYIFLIDIIYLFYNIIVFIPKWLITELEKRT